MTDDNSPENLRKFLESDDPAMVRMGLSMAKGTGVEITIKDLEHLLKSEDGETIKIGFAFAEEVGVGDEAIELLCERLADDDYDVRYCAAKALGEIGDARAVEPIMDALREHYLDDMKDFQMGISFDGLNLAEEAGVLEMAIECICEQMEWGTDRVRYTSALALGEVGDDRVIEPLVKALDDENGHVHEAAVIALGEIGWEPETDELRMVYLLAKNTLAPVNPDEWGESAVEPLIKALEEGRWPRWRSTSAAVALGEIGDARAVEPLIEALGDDDVSWAAAEALGMIGKPAVELLIEALGDDDVSYYAAEALGMIGDARAVEPLIKALEDEEVRAAAEALGKIGDMHAVEPLIELLEDEDEDVRDAAKEALRELGHEVE